MTEEHPRRRRALSWGEVPITRIVQPQAQANYTPPRAPAPAGKKNWQEFPTNLTSSIFLARDQRLIKLAEDRIKETRERARERQAKRAQPDRG